MNIRRVLTAGFAVAVVALGTWAFYTNVLDPDRDGQARGGLAVAESSTLDPATMTSGTEGAGGENAAVPPLLGGLELTALLSGKEALAAVEQLHGEALGAGLDAAWVAQYGKASQVMLWLSRSVAEEGAQTLFERMTNKIAEGNSPFTGLKPMADSKLEGYELDGMGQKHFYFVTGNDLYWVAVSPSLARSVLADLAETVVPTPAEVN
ncbi:MAG: hypothetical protein A2W26_06940 [Acidobacteria bacterium RBG_16_64_8]|nr:MAG: hypothetical protein A2W26_06940 [Acidobacteria bacterium RBG_16_64_8]